MSLRLPAEWETQSGLLLTWPHPETDWGYCIDEIEKVFLEITRHTIPMQPVIIACHNELHRNHVEKLLLENTIQEEKFRCYIAPSNDSWVRDHGPITVLGDDSPVIMDFIFDGWGGKFNAECDNLITNTLYEAGAFGNIPKQNVNFILEGGSIETDGLGTFLVTSSCLLSPTRNDGLNRNAIESRLRQYLGARDIHWIHNGMLCGDDTDGHIDTLMRFADTGTILYVSCKDKTYPGYESLYEMEKDIQKLRQPDNRPYHLVPLPLPVIVNEDGEYLPASYVNFLIINNAVLMPIYESAEDEIAMSILANCFPDRKIIGINCRSLISQNGSLHCVTMQLPAGVIK